MGRPVEAELFWHALLITTAYGLLLPVELPNASSEGESEV